MKEIAGSDFANNLKYYINRINSKSEPIVIKRKGSAAVLMSLEEYKDMKEKQKILAD